MNKMNEMPRTMQFDNLITHPLFHTFTDNKLPGKFYRWQILLRNGWWYSNNGDNQEIGYLCPPESKVDPNTLS